MQIATLHILKGCSEHYFAVPLFKLLFMASIFLYPFAISLENRDKGSSRSPSVQNLLKIYGELHCDNMIGTHSSRISTHDNIEADFLSRPDLTLTRSQQLQTTYQKLTKLQQWRYFRPNRGILSVLSSALCNGPCPTRPKIPATYGHFEHASSTSPCLIQL